MITFNVRVVGKEGMLEPMRKRMEKLTLHLSDEQITERSDELCSALADEFKCRNQGSGLDPVFVFGAEDVPKKKLPKPEVKYSVEKKPVKKNPVEVLSKKLEKINKKPEKAKSKKGLTGGAGLLF